MGEECDGTLLKDAATCHVDGFHRLAVRSAAIRRRAAIQMPMCKMTSADGHGRQRVSERARDASGTREIAGARELARVASGQRRAVERNAARDWHRGRKAILMVLCGCASSRGPGARAAVALPARGAVSAVRSIMPTRRRLPRPTAWRSTRPSSRGGAGAGCRQQPELPLGAPTPIEDPGGHALDALHAALQRVATDRRRRGSCSTAHPTSRAICSPARCASACSTASAKPARASWSRASLGSSIATPASRTRRAATSARSASSSGRRSKASTGSPAWRSTRATSRRWRRSRRAPTAA